MLDQSKDEETIFKAAARLRTPAEQIAYIKNACGDDSMLLARVASLLQVHSSKNNLLDFLIPDPDVTLDDSPICEVPGTVIGRYKLLEKIGEGGMAVVYMAEQQEPIRRKVALKIIKLGMDTKSVIARFEAERQALAMMDHPNIAKVLDAGATETGRPYFVMELVTGVSITEYCDKNSLSTIERLELFIQVCNAVQHAHQKGIIHRDIKPTNVMVTLHDGKPVPKVIDFGIAKAINQKLTEKTLFTRYAHIVGTPAYMSPEQAELSDLDIDTRSDIYSLGVLLYELLTGTPPFGEEELRKAGYLEMQRVIREQEPAKPSTKLSTLGKTLTDVAERHNSTPDLLRKAVRGDLDWIVMKSLEKDRARRYETPSGLAEDIRRHLESEPVLARGPGTTYRLHRFLRRHRSQALGALALAAVLTAAGIVLFLWSRARLQLEATEDIRHQSTLSQAHEQYAKGERQAALETITPLLASKHVGPGAQLLYATILVEGQLPDEATAMLSRLLDDRPAIAGAAHALWARILYENQSPSADKSAEIEEHRQRADALLPETAEAYFLRAMMAVTVKEQLAFLDEALRLERRHYESLRLRAFLYYASRKYKKMRDDAFAMTYVRPTDPLGYSLWATALRELGEYDEAMEQYDNAIALSREQGLPYLDLATQRSEALLRKGDHQRVLTDAEACQKLWPDKVIFQYLAFCARTNLGDYDNAAALFRQIVSSGRGARDQFWDWSGKYVFDTLAAGRSWHPADRAPAGAAFLPLIEAEETYRRLSAKARLVVKDGFSAQWSPEGKKLAFSIGIHGYSGVAVYDPATKETELLIVPGKDPRWSPDGRYIAFVRDCQVLRLREFAGAGRKEQYRPLADEEVWVMKSDGTEPRRLAAGGYPSWGRDSTCLYYQSRVDETFNSISIVDRDAKPQQIMRCSYYWPSISPNSQRVAFVEGRLLKIRGLASQASVAQWSLPLDRYTMCTWSPAGDEVCLAGGPGSPERWRPRLWIYRLGQSTPTTVLPEPIAVASWSADGTKFAFHLDAPYLEIWTADLDPNVSAIEALAPAQTLEEHWRDRVRVCTRRIEADPMDTVAYYDRARYYDHLHERSKAEADMRRWSAVMSGRSPSDSWLGMPGSFRRVIDMPFNCELVFSAERPVNNMPVLSIAFGQKGKCNMKSFQIPILSMSLLGLCLLSGLDAPPARADFTFGQPVDVHSDFPYVDPADEWTDCFSADGLEVYFESWGGRPGGYGGPDIWVCKRASVEDAWGAPENLGPLVNSPGLDAHASISADGLELYFHSNRPGGYGKADLYVTRRATRTSPWEAATNLGPLVNTSQGEAGPAVSPDGLELYFSSNRPGGYGSSDAYVSTRATRNDPWGAPVNLGPAVNSPGSDDVSSLSPDGLLMVFGSDRPGGFGPQEDGYMTRRASRSAPWQPAVNLGPVVNRGVYNMPLMSADGSAVHIIICNPNNIWTEMEAPILPIVDFNADGKVDIADVFIMLEHWLTDYPLCDIGPYAWGDGIVDAKDLIVLAEHIANTPAAVNDVNAP